MKAKVFTKNMELYKELEIESLMPDIRVALPNPRCEVKWGEHKTACTVTSDCLIGSTVSATFAGFLEGHIPYYVIDIDI